MSKIAVFAKLTAKADKVDIVRETFEKLVESTASEDGTLLYGLHQDAGSAETFWFYELYADNDALAAHSGSAAMADAFKVLGDALAEPPMLVVTNPMKAKGLPI
jgi:quinol monooxygenase YgiN